MALKEYFSATMVDVRWTRKWKSPKIGQDSEILIFTRRTQPAILTLLEIHRHCPEVLSQLEIYVDGGIQRGTDILKALALGATAVGIWSRRCRASHRK